MGPRLAYCRTLDCASINTIELGQVCKLTAAARIDATNMHHVLIVHLCSWMRRSAHYRRMQCAVPSLILDIFCMSGPPDIAHFIVRGNPIPMRNLMLRRRLRAVKRFGHEHVDTHFSFARNGMQMHIAIAHASDPWSENTPRLFAAYSTM